MTNLPDSTFFDVTLDGAVAHIEMNRPDKANGMSPDFWADLPRIAEALNGNPSVRCAVLSGRGRHFSGGMDLATFQDINTMLTQEPGRAAYLMRDLVLRLQASLSSLEKMRIPVIAATHGASLGAAVDVISACDIRMASRDTSFGIEEIHIGMAADVGTLQRLPKIMPMGIVSELAYTGRRFSAEEAHGWGMVNSVYDTREATIAAALDFAHGIAEKSPLAIAGIKRSITFARDHRVDDALDQIATWNAGMLRPEDLTKAITAKMTKQKAVFDDLLAEAV